MSVITATAEDLRLVRDITHTGARRQVNLGDEDLVNLVDNGTVLLVVDGGGAWGLAAFYHEPHPSTLSRNTPDRVYLRAVAFRRNTSPSEGMNQLVAAYGSRPSLAARLLIAYGGEGWFDRTLQAAGFGQAEQVNYFELAGLRRCVERLPLGAEPAQLRSATLNDIETLAHLDAATFDVIWHMTAPDLQRLLLVGRIEVAQMNGDYAGYTAMTASDDVGQLARLAVHPRWQGQGIGRQLLVDSLRAAEQMGCRAVVLNTQAANTPAHALYRSVGFRQTGEQFAVFTRLLPPARSVVV